MKIDKKQDAVCLTPTGWLAKTLKTGVPAFNNTAEKLIQANKLRLDKNI